MGARRCADCEIRLPWWRRAQHCRGCTTWLNSDGPYAPHQPPYRPGSRAGTEARRSYGDHLDEALDVWGDDDNDPCEDLEEVCECGPY